MRIIGITGRARQGKDTVADYLVEKRGYIKYSLADPIKQIAKIVYGFSYDQLYGDAKDKEDERVGTTPRKILQILGTEIFQEDMAYHIDGLKITDNVWVQAFKPEPGKKYVIPDIRFNHEYEYLKQFKGFKLWEVVRPGVNVECDHKSEEGVNKILDATIVNNGSIEDLWSKIIEILI